jgi:hypothetical protein
MGVYRHALTVLQPKDQEGYRCFAWTSLLGQKQTARFRIQSDSGKASNHLCQLLYVEEEEEYSVASRCHVRRKGALENDFLVRKNGRSGN